jgi:autotransporter-associated beta strand protein
MLPGGLIDVRVTSDNSPVLGSIFQGQPTGTLTLAGKISGAGSFFKGHTTTEADYAIPPSLQTLASRFLDGEVILSNSSNDFTGNVTINDGTLVVSADHVLGSTAGQTIVTGSPSVGGTLAFKGGVNYVTAEKVTIAGTGGVLSDNTGAINNLNGDNSFAGPIVVGGNANSTGTVATSINIASGSLSVGTITGAAALNKTGAGTGVDLQAASIRLKTANASLPALTISSGRVTLAPNGLAAGVSILRNSAGTTNLALSASAALLDITNNHVILTDSVGTVSGFVYSDVTGLIQTGYNPGTPAKWDGASGIVTTQTDATTSNFKSIGVATAAQAKGVASNATAVWAGQTVTGSETLVMYTYGGDANLDGKVNVDDYVRIDSNVGLFPSDNSVAAWYNGDFNYDGKVNVDDYVIIDSNVANAQPPLFAGGGLGGGSGLSVVAVPEPGTVSLLGLGAAALMGRRRRRSK